MFKDFNFELLEILREKSRTKLSICARKLNKPITTIYFEYQKLLKNVIIKNTCILDFEKLGLKRYLLIANCSPELLNNINIKINNLFRTNEGVIAEIFFLNEKEKNEFLIKLSEKRITYSYHPIFENIKQEDFKFYFSK